jgi:hypothetical protein
MPFRVGPWEFAIIILLLPSLAVYFVPTIIAVVRRVRHSLGIVLLNIFGGWTFVGWVIALVWSILDKKQSANG